MQPKRLTETVQLVQPTPSTVYTTFVKKKLIIISDESIDESISESKQNLFDVITSKVRRNRDYCVGQVFLLVVYMPTMNYSCIYLAELRSVQNHCNFATICTRKRYRFCARPLAISSKQKYIYSRYSISYIR